MGWRVRIESRATRVGEHALCVFGVTSPEMTEHEARSAFASCVKEYPELDEWAPLRRLDDGGEWVTLASRSMPGRTG